MGSFQSVHHSQLHYTKTATLENKDVKIINLSLSDKVWKSNPQPHTDVRKRAQTCTYPCRFRL